MVSVLIETYVPDIKRVLQNRMELPAFIPWGCGIACMGYVDSVRCVVKTGPTDPHVFETSLTISILSAEEHNSGSIVIRYSKCIDRFLHIAHSWMSDEELLNHEMNVAFEQLPDSDSPQIQICYGGTSDTDMSFAVVALVRMLIAGTKCRGND